MTDHKDRTNKPLLQLVIDRHGLSDHTKERGAPGSADKTQGNLWSEDNADPVELTQDAVDQIECPELVSFISDVLVEPEVREVIQQPVHHEGEFIGLRIQLIEIIGMRMRDSYDLEPIERDCIYVATLLHGIEYCLKPKVREGSNLRDVMFTIVREYLHVLDTSSPKHAQLVRLCMGWGNTDEESIFVVWLQQRMQRAIQLLISMRF